MPQAPEGPRLPLPDSRYPNAEGRTAVSVTELVKALRGSVENAVGQLWIKGEVTSLKAYGSGHWYFTLRDEESSIRCVMWKTYTTRTASHPAEGTQVYVLASPTVWEERGELRLSVVVLLASSAQGQQHLAKESARAALVRAIGRVNRLSGVDLCVVGRGGGSREDLLAFDDERVCRAIAGLRMPSISAVGHETDISLADLVADQRAATPSAAIELALPDRHDCLRHVGSLGARLAHGLGRRTGVLLQRLARSGDRMQVAMQQRIEGPRARLDRVAGQLDALSPLAVLARGYSVARLRDGRIARRQADLPKGTQFILRVGDGDVPSRSTGL